MIIHQIIKLIKNINMSRYETSEDSSSSVETEDNSEESYEKPYVAKIKYISDGLNENDYKISNVANNNLVKSHCCGKFFTPAAYMHQTKYGLKIQDMITCIHCYIDFNSYKFIDCLDMTTQDEECLKYYINTFTEEHQTMKCTRTGPGSHCVLCNAIRGIYPPLIAKEMEIAKANAPEQDEDMNDNPYNNIRIIDRPNMNSNSYVLVL